VTGRERERARERARARERERERETGIVRQSNEMEGDFLKRLKC
jgi:hypothetical protein